IHLFCSPWPTAGSTPEARAARPRVVLEGAADVTVKILLVGREQPFRDRLRLALERLEASGETVEFVEASDGNGANALAEAQGPRRVVALPCPAPAGPRAA